jgi:hypothetical protein
MAQDPIDVYQYHWPQKVSPKNSTHNPSFEVCKQFLHIPWWILFHHKYISYVEIHQCFNLFFKI